MNYPRLTEPHKQVPDWLYWLEWVAASLAAGLLASVMIFAVIFIGTAILPGLNEDRVAGWIMVPILATVLGTLQWLVLRQRMPRSAWWILGTVAGVLIGLALAEDAFRALQHNFSQPWIWESQPGLLLFYLIIGVSLGLAQIPILWRRGRSVALWLLASIVGWFFLGLIVGVSIDKTTDILALGAVPAAFTGLGLVWLTSPTVSSNL